jgi:hypothetical protein
MTTLSTSISNLRNRIEASKKAPRYNERTHVDAPAHELEALLGSNEKLYAALMVVTQALEAIVKSPHCAVLNREGFARRVAAAKAALAAAT